MMWFGWIIATKDMRYFLQSIGVDVFGAEAYPTGARFFTNSWLLDVRMSEETFERLDNYWGVLVWHLLHLPAGGVQI